MQLNEIADNEGARKNRIRVGRGIGCGKGKTCGRGVKGQTSRSGVAINGFEGGQMPIHRRLPKRGFKNHSRTESTEVNTGDLQRAIDAGKLDAKKEINREALIAAGLIKTRDERIKLLGKGALTAKVKVTVCKASKTAVEAIEKAGGTITLA